MEFRKATKEQSKLRLAVFGPSGAGKTYTALRLATGLGGRIAFIDTERGSANKYADRFDFDVLDLPARDIATYCAAINVAAKAGYETLIIDSLTHGWIDLLGEVDKLARAKYSGNTWAAWSEGTPKQRAFVDVMLNFDGHIIATMRTRTEWLVTKDDRGRDKPVRVGLAPEQGKGIEYEFDLLMEISTEHIATVIKDRTSRFQDRMIEKPGEELGKELVEWLREGVPPRPRPEPAPEPMAPADNGGNELDRALGRTPNNLKVAGNGHGEKRSDEPPARKPADLLKVVNARVEVGYDNLAHLVDAIKAKLGAEWRPWPAFKDVDGWWAAYNAAMAQAKAQVSNAQAEEELPF
jgi:hypothetical protein